MSAAGDASAARPHLPLALPLACLQPENSPLNVGMAPASWSNSYYAPDAAAPWKMQFYDYPGSLNVPYVNAYEPVNE
jgi:hypothetical protein